ncbi:hypothetical protein PR202_ga11590 [Eleusine coracana subsp. coracana]|uniref:Transcription repressor n=1 Tax=Eleusine coracana subsp. coracana TaxID=191504 RepID=A0AAV5C9V5_ELECO|nr:hypothetical protein PR202_ga11590 [Eleusine coracana subsp. coracana]
MDSSRSGGRRLKDRLARLLRPANSLLRSSCSSSSATSTAFTTTPAATTISPTSSTSTTAANYTTAVSMLPRAEPFSTALDRLRHPPPERVRINNNKAQVVKEASSSSRHGSRRHSKQNVIDIGGVRALSSNPYGFTTSSDEEKEEDDDDDETEAFFSTRTRSLLSSDASAFYRRKHHPPPNSNKRRRRPQRRRRRRGPAASCVDTCGGGASEPGFRPLVMAAAEEVRRGLAVVKRSRDPYGDFRESMVQVIVERQVFGAAELEGLLDSYMALNAPCLHPVILQAFSDIWLVLYGGG